MSELDLMEYAIANIYRMTADSAFFVLEVAKKASVKFPPQIEAMLKEKAAEQKKVEELPEV